MRKKWTKPELVVVVRGSAEERVLTGCKDGTPGPEGAFNVCTTKSGLCQFNCDAQAIS